VRRSGPWAVLLVAALPWALGGCVKQEHGLNDDAADLVSDTSVLEEASAAANDVVRNAAECDAVKAALPETRRRLAEAAKRVRTETGRTTLASLNKQVAAVAGQCP
jgi:biotin synthase-like enzyme